VEGGSIASRSVPGFLPSESGFHFPNAFPRVPVRRIGIPGVVSLPIGDASDGLCGGMAFAVRDYFEASRPPPPDTSPPSDGPLFDYLVQRLLDSFHLPYGPARYLELMNTALPDGETWLTRIGALPHGRAWRALRVEWPKVRTAIDQGHPAPLGLVRIKSLNPFDLKHNHQVLAYGYELTGDSLLLRIYDPNFPDRDDVTLSIRPLDPSRPVLMTGFPSSGPVHAFFAVDYRPIPPP
jgi:hypothetical protein